MKKKSKLLTSILGLFVLGLMVVTSIMNVNIKASTELFTLDSVPTTNHEVAGVNPRNVGTTAEYLAAVQDQTVDVINFTGNITFTAGGAMGQSVNRDLLINGNGYVLTIFGNSTFGPARPTGSIGGTLFALGGTGGTLHIKDLTLERTLNGNGQNDVISVMTASNDTWDVIFDGLIFTFEGNQWSGLLRVPADTLNTARIFFRNTSNLRLGSSGPVIVTNGAVVFEGNSIANVTGRSNNAVNGIAGSDTKIYIDSGAQTTFEIPPQIWSGNRGVLGGVNEINIYPNASLNVTGVGNATIPAINTLDSNSPMTFRVASDASLNVESTGGAAIQSVTGFPVKVLGNPNSNVAFYGAGTTPTVQMSLSGSELSLSSPKSYNIQNNGTGIAFTGINNTTPTLNLLQTNVGVWLQGSSLAGAPQVPSPFQNVDVVTGSGGALSGSSSLLDTMSGGWNTGNYRKISYVTIAEISANDISLGLLGNQSLNASVVPTDATLTYVSNDPSIATVDGTGNVTAVGEGSTTITITANVAGGFPSTKDVVVTVTNEVPVLTVPAFSEIPLNGSFNPLNGVSAIDTEDGDISGSIIVTNPVNSGVAGVYNVSYSITDSSNNTVTAHQVVLVNDGTYQAGNTYILHASDFTRRVGQVDATDAGIRTAAGVQVYLKGTGAQTANTVNIVDNGGYTAAAGGYAIALEVSGDTASRRNITGTVVTGDSPTITIPAFTEISVGGTFNPLTGVSATDTEDGNLTGAVTYTGTYDVNVPGVYPISYSVTDSDNNTATGKQVLLVNDTNFGVGNNFIIKASDFTKRVGQVNVSDAAVKTAAGVTVYDKLTGAEVIEPVTVNLGTYSSTPGTYNITFTVTSDVGATQGVTGTVITGGLPTLTVPAFTEINVGGTFNPLTGVSATDTEDGNLTGAVTYTGTYDVNVPGVYTISYSVTDSDNNTATGKQVLLVNDTNFGVGNNFIIKASDFTKRVGQVVVTEDAVKTAAGVTVYDKLTGAEVIEPVTVNLGTYSSTPGTHNITFTVTSDVGATQGVIGTVITGGLPTLTVPSFTEISVGGTFNPLTGVSATDTEDGNLTGAVTYTGTYDVNVPGVYPISYSVTDSDNNTSTGKQVLLVNDTNFGVGNNFIIKASDFTKRVGQVNVSDAAVKTAAGVTVYDKLTGAEVIEPVTVNLGTYSSTPGTYNITFTVTSDVGATQGVVGTVITGGLPTLTVPAFTEINVGGTFNPLTGVSATDTEDGNLTGAVTYTGAYDVNVPGVYPISYSVTDSDNNTATGKQVLLVNDTNFGVGNNFIIKASDFTKRLGQVNTSDAAVKTAASVTVYDKLTGQEVIEPVTITSLGGYGPALGSYNITFHVTSDPGASIIIQGTVEAGNLPVLTAPAFTEISVGGSFNPLTGVSASDSEDGNLTSSITFTGTYNVNVPGVYPITYSVTDSDHNTVTKIQTLLVNDSHFVVGNQLIITAHDFTKRISQVDMDPDAIKAAANVVVYSKATGTIVPESVDISSLGGYGPTPGTYTIGFRAVNDNLAQINISGRVIGGTPPVITAPTFTEIPLGGSFDPMAGVTATDVEDGNITGSITKSGTYDVDVEGLYPIDYHVIDSDGNEATTRQVLMVNSGKFDAGDHFILQANDFTRTIGQVDTSSLAVQLAANVRVFDKETGFLTGEPVTITNLGGYGPTPGTYQITFQVTNDPTTQRTITATVITGSSPVLTAPSFSEIPLGGSFDPMAGVSATDAEDGDLTSSIVYIGGVDSEIAGTYEIIYSVIDSDHNEVTARQIVLVNDNDFVVGNNYILRAADFTNFVGSVDSSDGAIKEDAGIAVYDKATGALTNEDVTIVNTSGYGPVPGEYAITFRVTNDSSAERTITGTVISGEVPVLTHPDFTEVAKGGTFNPMDGVQALDDEDGDITSSIVVTGSVNLSVAGVYELHYSVVDSDNNEATGVQIVLVNDGSYTVGDTYIMTARDFSVRVSLVNTTDIGLQAAAQVKVYEKATGMITAEPVTVNQGSFGPSVGDYPISFSVASEPSVTKTVTASVITGEIPVITNPTFTEIKVGGLFNPLAGVSASDIEDGDLTDQIILEGSVNRHVPGVYTMTYRVFDSDGNEGRSSQVIVVNDENFVIGNSYLLYAKDFTLNVSQVDSSTQGIITSAQGKVYDKTTGQLVSQPIVVDDTGGFGPVAGEYDIILSVSGDAMATRSILGTVLLGEAPTISGPTFTEIAVGSVFNPLEGITANDHEDGDITANITTNGNIDTHTPGVYVMIYSVEDTDGNVATLSRTILVNEGSFTAGEQFIIRAFDFTLPISEVNPSLAALMISANTTVYDKQSGQLVSQPIEIVDLGGFTQKAGVYTITFKVKGDALAEHSVEATVVAGNPPELTVPAFTEVALGGIFDPLLGVTATDIEDGDLTAQIVIDNPVDVHTPGVYVVTYSVKDADLNEVIAHQIVVVNDGHYVIKDGYAITGRDFTLNQSEVRKDPAFLIEKGQIVVYDLKTGRIVENPNIIVDMGGLSTEPGVYTISFTFNPTISLKVTVVADGTNSNNGGIGSLLPNTGGNSWWILGSFMIILGLFSFNKFYRYKK